MSPEFADDVIVEAKLANDGAYTAVGYYPFEEMQRMLNVLINKTGKSANSPGQPHECLVFEHFC